MTAREEMLSSTELGALENEIVLAITQFVKRKESTNEHFACEHDLRTVWGEKQRVERLLKSYLSPEQLEFVRCHLIKVLSTLIWIGWHRWSEFERIFLHHLNSEARPDRLDDSLPILDELELAHGSFLADPVPARLFFADQYVFLPISIREDEDQSYPKARRLPFVKISEEVREGSYGKVSKELVACRYFVHKSGNLDQYPSQTEVEIALKCQNEDKFKDEVRNLDLLRSSVSKHARIMLHLGTLIHGDKFYIFFPWADMDLRDFIYGEGHRDKKKPIYLLEEASNLADALAFLHSGINIPGGRQVSCVHMDLKPENIVVRLDGKSPAGTWMITDFGISTIKQSSDDQTAYSAPSNTLSALKSVKDVEASLTKTVPKRRPGPFQAPEVQDTTARGVGRKSDVWSLGCILCLVFASGEGSGMVSSFDKERSRDGDPDISTDYFYREVEPVTASRTGVKWEVKKGVFSWLETLAKGCDVQRDWVRDYVNLMKEMIVIDMYRRLDARKVHTAMGTILEKARVSEVPPSYSSSQNGSPTPPHESIEQPSPQPPAPSKSLISTNAAATSSREDSKESSNLRPASITGSLESSLVRLQLPQGEIFRTTFSPTGDLVAFLSETCVFLYVTRHLDTGGLWVKKLNREIHLSAVSGMEIHDEKNRQWRSISLSGRYILIRGLLGVTLYELSLMHQRKLLEIAIHDCPDPSRLVEAEVSYTGQIVFRFTDHLKVWCPETSRQNGHVHPLTITGSPKAASFSSDGNFLCVWACGSGPNHWYIWDAHTEPPVLVCTGNYGSDRFGPPIEALVPLAKKAAFVIRENQGKLSIVQKLSTATQPNYFAKLLSGIITCTYAPGYDALIFVRSHSNWFGKRSRDRIEMLSFLSDFGGSVRFTTGSELQELGHSERQIRDVSRCGVAVTKAGAAGPISLLISHPDGVLEKLTS